MGAMYGSPRRGRAFFLALPVTVAGAPTAWGSVDPLTLVNGPSPLAPGCEGVPQTGTVFRNAEVEPWVDGHYQNRVSR